MTAADFDKVIAGDAEKWAEVCSLRASAWIEVRPGPATQPESIRSPASHGVGERLVPNASVRPRGQLHAQACLEPFTRLPRQVGATLNRRHAALSRNGSRPGIRPHRRHVGSTSDTCHESRHGNRQQRANRRHFGEGVLAIVHPGRGALPGHENIDNRARSNIALLRG
jgi:hypothetical protein